LDATAVLWYANVGHGRPEIRAAIAAEMERSASSKACLAFFDLARRPVLQLTEARGEQAPMPSNVFVGSGGSDGVETAAKLACRCW
jgi:adenosylmethionine-8-amino-7-oxononanoate aminotransferase